MKKLRLISVLALSFFMAFVSCNKDNTQSPEIKVVTPPEYDPSDCDINHLLNSKIFIPSSISGTLLGNSLSVRCKEIATTSLDADIIIITDDIAINSDHNAMIDIAKALLKGKMISYAYPTNSAFSKFIGDLDTAIEALAGDDDFFADADCLYVPSLIKMIECPIQSGNSESFARMVSVCKKGIHIMGGINDATFSCTSTEIDPETQAETVQDMDLEDETFEDTPHLVGGLVEMFIEWANEKMREGNSSEPTPHELNWTPAVDYDNVCQFRAASLPAIWDDIKRDMNFKIRYEYLPVCKISGNTISDIYAVRRVFMLEGNQLQTGPNDQHEWWEGRDRFYGPYLRRVLDNTDCSYANRMRELKPQNSMTSTDYNETTTYGVQGGITIGEKPSVDIGFNYSKAYGVTTKLPDIATYVSTENFLLPRYTHMCEKRPATHNPFDPWHDNVPLNYHQHLEFETSWIWDIDNPRDEAHAFSDHVEIDIEIMRLNMGVLSTFPSYHTQHFVFSVNRWKLPALPHYSQHWGVEVDNKNMTRDEKLKLMDWLDKRYAKFYYTNAIFNVWAYSLNDRSKIQNFRNEFISALKSDIHVWKNLDYYGTFTFTWRNKDTGETYTYDHVVEK